MSVRYKDCEIICFVCISGNVSKIITINNFFICLQRVEIFLQTELSEKGHFEY